MRATSTRIALALAALAGCAGCTSGFDRNDQIVNSLRILGVGAHVDSGDGIDWADADVGDTIHLSALVANPGGLSTVMVTWVACLPIPGQSQPCTDDQYLRDPVKSILPLASDPTTTGVVELGQGTDVDYVVPQEVQPLLQNQLYAADKSSNAECALYIQIPVLVIAQDTSTGAEFSAVRNIRLSPWKTIAAASDPAYAYYPRNANPTIDGFNLGPSSLDTCDGQPLATPCLNDAQCPAGATCQNRFCRPDGIFPDGPQTLCLSLGQAQSYYTCGLDGPQIANPGDPPNVPEQPSVTWYMTAGSLSGFAAPSNGSGGSVLCRRARPPGRRDLGGPGFPMNAQGERNAHR
jgi:hypothetical protein